MSHQEIALDFLIDRDGCDRNGKLYYQSYDTQHYKKMEEKFQREYRLGIHENLEIPPGGILADDVISDYNI